MLFAAIIFLSSFFIANYHYDHDYSDAEYIHEHGEVDEELKPYVKSFEDMFGIDIFDIKIKLVIFEDNKINGICRWYLGDYSIYINANYWYDRKWYLGSKESLMYHELGHCVYDLDHKPTNEEVEFGWESAAHIMYAHPVDRSVYRENRSFYIESFKKYVKDHGILNKEIAKERQ